MRSRMLVVAALTLALASVAPSALAEVFSPPPRAECSSRPDVTLGDNDNGASAGDSAWTTHWRDDCVDFHTMEPPACVSPFQPQHGLVDLYTTPDNGAVVPAAATGCERDDEGLTESDAAAAGVLVNAFFPTVYGGTWSSQCTKNADDTWTCEQDDELYFVSVSPLGGSVYVIEYQREQSNQCTEAESGCVTEPPTRDCYQYIVHAAVSPFDPTHPTYEVNAPSAAGGCQD